MSSITLTVREEISQRFYTVDHTKSGFNELLPHVINMYHQINFKMPWWGNVRVSEPLSTVTKLQHVIESTGSTDSFNTVSKWDISHVATWRCLQPYCIPSIHLTVSSNIPWSPFHCSTDTPPYALKLIWANKPSSNWPRPLYYNLNIVYCMYIYISKFLYCSLSSFYMCKALLSFGKGAI